MTGGSDSESSVADIVRLVAAAKKNGLRLQCFPQGVVKVETFPVSRAAVIAAFAAGLKEATGTWSGSAHVELAETHLVRASLQCTERLSHMFAKGPCCEQLCINGKVFDSVGTLEQDLMQVIFAEQQRMQQLVQRGIIRDKTNAYAYFTGTDKKKKKSLVSSAFAFSHHDSRILVDDERAEFVPLVSAKGKNSDEVDAVALPHDLLLEPSRQKEIPYDL